MAEFEEVEFERVRSEEPSEDIEMPDVVQFCAHDESDQHGTDRPYDDVLMTQSSLLEPHQSIEQDSEEPKFIIAVDFGTTFSSVAFVRLESNTPARLIGSESIRCIDNFPDMPPGISADLLTGHQTVPTELMLYTQKDKVSSGDPSDFDSSDRESQCSLDGDWASSSEEEFDTEREKNISSRRASKDTVGNSIWGWGVHSRLAKPESIPQDLKHLQNFKLLLDEGPDTRKLRKESALDLKTLKPAKVVDIITEYLVQLFKHTKARLTALHGLHENSHVELVLCVPTSWTDRACRVMQDALTTAIKISQLTKLQQGVIKDLFIVAESEAAASYALEDRDSSSKMITHESFLLLDCGGGTVDAVTYKLTRTTPIRMEEVVDPEGTSCGSSFLNRNYEKLLQERLKQARFVENDLPLERIIAVEVQKFENEKRSINILDKKARIDSVHISGLQPAEGVELRIRKNKLDLNWKDMYDVFKDCLRGISDLMLKQLNAAKDKGVNVQTVILTGGFGESPSLRNHLKKVLRKERNQLNQPIDFQSSHYVQSAVARGAVLRALRKEFGPDRITRSSYGVLGSELYDENNSKHRKFRVSRHPADGELYIMHTIHWVIEKVRWYNSKTKWISTVLSN